MNTSGITLIGNVTATPELNQVGNGQSKLTFTVACDYRFQKNGNWESKPSFIRVVAWRDLADRAKGLLDTGSRVIVTGRLDQRSWKDESTGKTLSMVEVVADDVALSVRGITAATRRPASSSGQIAAEDDSAW